MSDRHAFLPETETPVPIIRPPGAGRVVGILRGATTFKVTSAETSGAYAVLEQQVPAGHGPPLHVHRHETEIFYILEGKFEVTVGGRVVPAPAGTCATCPRDIPHTFRNVGDSPGRLLVTIIPGHFGDYFIEADGVADGDLAAITALCAKYGVEVL